MNTYYHYLDSPIGQLLLVGDGNVLTGLYMEAHKYGPLRRKDWIEDAAPFAEACDQLADYFAGKLQKFSIPFRLSGTVFQQQVWRGLCEIPFGKTLSYKGLADYLGAPKAVRAVGLANGKNPLSVIIPCHRVIGSDGRLVGYGGGLQRKQWLLSHEAYHDPARLL